MKPFFLVPICFAMTCLWALAAWADESELSSAELARIEHQIPVRNGRVFLRMSRLNFLFPQNCRNNEIAAPARSFILEGTPLNAEQLLVNCYGARARGYGQELSAELGFWRALFLADIFHAISYQEDRSEHIIYLDPSDDDRQFHCSRFDCFLFVGSYDAVSISDPAVDGASAEVLVQYQFVPHDGTGEIQQTIERIAAQNGVNVGTRTSERSRAIGDQHVFRFTRFGDIWTLRE